jgi:hypothetical protein
MKNLPLPLLALCLLLSCSSDNDEPNGLGTIGSGVPVYDETLIPESVPPLPNLISNGDFESDGGWINCGGARYEQRNFATSGGGVLVVDSRSVCEAGASRDIVAAATQEINLPGGTPDVLTISFQVRADGLIPSLAFDIYLSNAAEEPFQIFGGYRITSITQEADEASSWNLITLLVTGSQIETQIEASPLFLTFQFRGSAEIAATTIYLDDVRVTDGFQGTTQATAMPDALRTYAGDSRILFYKLTTEDQTVASMRPNGTDMLVYEQIPAATVEGAPRWFGGNQITLAQKEFNPPAPSDPSILPGGGTSVIKYNLASGDEELVYRTIGEPGKFLFVDALENRAALDFEVRRTAWDPERNRGALCACGRNRSPQFELNSDDICKLFIIDATTNEIINDEVNGFAPEWSASGRLAYYYADKIYTATVSEDGRPNPTVVYEGPALLQAADWSPDETQLVIAEMGSGSAVISGEIKDIYTIKILDLATGQAENLLRVDHGSLIGNLSWSPDGDFIIYSLNTSGNGAQVWWLEVATGQTGPITNTINGYAASWRK